MVKELLDKIKKTREKVEKDLSELIKETEFYRTYSDHFFEWYLYRQQEFMIVTGGYGIGKSRTIKQILEENGIEYVVINSRVEYEKDMLEYIDGLDKGDVIIFDDAFVSKRLVQMLFKMNDFGIRCMFIVNDIKELENISKVLGRAYKVRVSMRSSDLKKLKDGLAQIYNISYDNYVILNVRDLVSVTVYELTKDYVKIKPKLLIDEIYEEIEDVKEKKELLKTIIKKIYEKIIVTDEDLLVDIAVKVLGYSKNTAKRYIRVILRNIWVE